MEKNYILQDMIKKRVAVICRGSGDVVKLSELVEALYPGFGSRIICYKKSADSKEYGGEIAIRLEEYHGSLDYGWDRPSYYKRRGFVVVNLFELDCDFGEFETNDMGMNGLLFGG